MSAWRTWLHSLQHRPAGAAPSRLGRDSAFASTPAERRARAISQHDPTVELLRCAPDLAGVAVSCPGGRPPVVFVGPELALIARAQHAGNFRG